MRSKSDLFTKYDETLIQVRVPVPLSLKTVNSYLLKDGDSYVWIDPGLNTKHIQDFWQQFFISLNINPLHIKKIICTHQHPDHFGLAGYAQALTQAPVYLSKGAYQYANLLWSKDSEFAPALHSLFSKHAVPEHLILDIVDNLNWFKTLVYPFPEVSFINAGDDIFINNEHWTYIETDGHAKGHMMLLNNNTKLLLCGDQVLPHITPHVGVVPTEEDELPLKRFLLCLDEIKLLDVNMSYPGHGERFSNWSERIELITVHHKRRLKKMLDIIGEHKQINAFEMCNLIFGQHLHKQPQNLRFAITEIVAHLDYLVENGQISKGLISNQHYMYCKK